MSRPQPAPQSWNSRKIVKRKQKLSPSETSDEACWLTGARHHQLLMPRYRLAMRRLFRALGSPKSPDVSRFQVRRLQAFGSEPTRKRPPLHDLVTDWTLPLKKKVMSLLSQSVRLWSVAQLTPRSQKPSPMWRRVRNFGSLGELEGAATQLPMSIG
ncbi:hypothetical protein TRIATDRAFT_319530 [Trichoderma atroviride IMI 206040]|uniref:Uncharacterized protein n=1 Tax=Hypocrea atroviridis (strain ATCC 20476 / IMI 206040) TaxID=452589 RepID=G9NXP1_HYPAI|nr:uncharacterized protein TRIATDRAFT_319530 [Trichoderma atroviride IMI 206040]EHK44221.1 hypothetical protein TRIATDRAFT_319530 [Trichoderma atroviride IMI 206040]